MAYIFILQVKLILAAIVTNQIARATTANALRRESIVEVVAVAKIARFYYFFLRYLPFVRQR